LAKVRCRKNALVALKGRNVRVRVGVFYDANDPVVKAAPGHFETIEEYVAQNLAKGVVEAATAAPGETRTVTKPAAKKPTAKRAAGKK
jgi:hypothetical protein